MAGTIKGIIVEIGGDTSGLQKALRSVNTATSSLTKELRGVNSLLKLDPSNTELLSQKQKVLAENIQETSEKLDLLKSIQEQTEKAMADGTKISEENYRNLQREIINTENKLKDLQVQASKWTQAGDKLEAFGTKVTNISNKIDNLGSTLTTSLTLPVLAIGTAAVTTGNDFEAQMSRVQAIAGATKDELKLLTDQAIELGASTSFSATEVAAGMENLASAGFTTQEIMEAMPGLLDLAASSGAELATASEIAASAIRGFGLEANQSAHVADVFAEAAARTNAQTEDMGNAMKYIAPVANTMGLKIEEVAAAIGIMSDAGIKGEQAGTTLRGALTRLTKPTDKMIKVMDNLGISFYDNEGKMKSLTEMISMLQNATANLTDEQEQNALTTLFGTESLSGMVALINRGSGDLADMTKSFEDCDGAAQEMADTMLDNTKGSIEEFKGSLESAGIAIQQALAPEIKKLAKWIQGLVDDFNDLSDEEKQNIVKMGLLVAAIGPAVKILGKLGTGVGTAVKGLGTFSKAVGLIGKTTTQSFKEASSATQTLAKGMTFLTSPTGLAVVAITALAEGLTYLALKQTEAQKKAQEFAEEMANEKQSFEEYNQSIDKTTSSNLAQINSVERLKNELSTLVDENGKVKEGYESRVSFILNEMNKALGTEYSLNGNIVQGYKDLQTEIDKTIEKKKAEILLQADEEKYLNAVKQESEAVENLKKAHDNLGMSLEEAQKKYDELVKKKEDYEKSGDIYNSDYIDTGKEIQRLDDLMNAYEDAETVVKETTENKKQYENNYALFVEGKYAEIGKTIKDTSKNWCDATIKTIQDSIIAEQSNLNKYKQIYQDTGNEVALQQQKQAQTNLTNLANELISRTSTIDSLGVSEIAAWKTLANNSYETYEEALSRMPIAMQNKIQEVTGVLISNTALPTEAGNLATRTVNAMERREQAKATGQNIVKGLQEGIQDKYLQTELMNSSATLADNMIRKMNLSAGVQSPSKYTRQTGRFVDEGLILGLKDKEKEVLKTASGLGAGIIKKMSSINALDMNKISQMSTNLNGKIINGTKTVYTTPQITFYVQKMNEENLQECFNFINRKFGSQY